MNRSNSPNTQICFIVLEAPQLRDLVLSKIPFPSSVLSSYRLHAALPQTDHHVPGRRKRCFSTGQRWGNLAGMYIPGPGLGNLDSPRWGVGSGKFRPDHNFATYGETWRVWSLLGAVDGDFMIVSFTLCQI